MFTVIVLLLCEIICCSLQGCGRFALHACCANLATSQLPSEDSTPYSLTPNPPLISSATSHRRATKAHWPSNHTAQRDGTSTRLFGDGKRVKAKNASKLGCYPMINLFTPKSEWSVKTAIRSRFSPFPNQFQTVHDMFAPHSTGSEDIHPILKAGLLDPYRGPVGSQTVTLGQGNYALPLQDATLDGTIIR